MRKKSAAMDPVERLLQVSRDYFNRLGVIKYNDDVKTDGYVMLKLLEGDDREASRVMARHGPYSGGYGNKYGYFLHVDLLWVLHRFGDRLSEKAKERLHQTLRKVSGISNHVNPTGFRFGNDNWPFNCSAIQILGGELLCKEEMIHAGLDKLRGYSRMMAGVGTSAERPCGVSSEHNSPTYAAVQLQPMAVLARCSKIPEARVRGVNWSEFTLMDIASHWHPAIQQQSGPYGRAYQDNILGGSGTVRFIAEKLWGPVFMEPEVGWQQEHAHDLAFAVVAAATDYPCPDYVRRLAMDKRFPYEVKASFALVKQDSPFPHSDPVSGEIYSYLSDRWMLGSASRAFSGHIGLAASPAAHWLRRAPVAAMKDFGVMYFRYQFDEKLPNQTNFEPWYDAQRGKCLLREDGAFFDYQDRNTVLHLTHPLWYYREAASLRQSALVPIYEDVEAVYAGGRKITHFPFTSPDPLTVVVCDRGTAVGLRPLEVTNLGRPYCTRIEKVNGHLIISWYNYKGRRRVFNFDELATMQNGLVVQVEDCRDETAALKFARRLGGAKVIDRFEGVLRHVTFDDGKIRMEGAHDFTWGCWKKRQANGVPFHPEVFRSPNIHSALGGHCEAGEAVLEGREDLPLRLVALDDAGLYGAYNFLEEPSDFTLRTPRGGTKGEALGFGRILYRSTHRGLQLVDKNVFRRRWA
jgi:hypothetical protein